ncbi:MAG: hypothetical protein HKM93_06270 [Desulfobacteraceae bacterium]|nr:hypothetical protein [Desulfobacteraceae bacterium]
MSNEKAQISNGGMLHKWIQLLYRNGMHFHMEKMKINLNKYMKKSRAVTLLSPFPIIETEVNE